MTQAMQAIEIVRKGINSPDARGVFQRDGINLDPLFEKRVHQVTKNRVRPKY